MASFALQFRDFARSAGPDCRLRLAPTPSGFLHAGNALNFILNWLTARLHGGKILLRIDDLDADRKRPEYVRDVFDSLHWLGLDWDEGPASPEDFEDTWSQHRRLPAYFALLERLRATGLLFACRRSRRDLAPFGGGYPPEFRDQGLSLDDADVAWRIMTPPDFPLPDFVVRRREGIPAYQVASLADDLYFRITHIVRGADLEASTAAQRFLARTLGENAFSGIRFLHHPLFTDEQGNKLSKSAGAASMKAMREAGAGPEAIFGPVAGLLGLEGNSAMALLKALRGRG